MKFCPLILFVLSLAAAEPISPPTPPSPVAEFRKWLDMEPARRTVALATRPEKSRALLEKKLEEYKALPVADRERRLNAIELRWLMDLPREKRAAALEQVSVLWRPIAEVRLRQWDAMSDSMRKEILDHQLTLQYFSSPPRQQEQVFLSLSSGDQSRLRERIARWTGMNPDERAQLDERIAEFFNMRPERQDKALENFPADQQTAMKQTLLAFRSLTPMQRQVCIDSFEKFAGMKREEQMAFLKNAERWQAMSPEDRNAWRRAVQIVPPMPELPAPAPQLPALPRR